MGEKGSERRLPFEGDEEKKGLTMKEIAKMQDREPKCSQCELMGICPRHDKDRKKKAS